MLLLSHVHDVFEGGGELFLFIGGREEKELANSCVCIVGWGNTPTEASFGGGGNDAASVKGKLVNLISSVRTLMRSEFARFFFLIR